MEELFGLLGNRSDSFQVDKDTIPLTLKDAKIHAKQVERSIKRYGMRAGATVRATSDSIAIPLIASGHSYSSSDLGSTVSTMFSLADKLEKLTINLVRAADMKARDENMVPDVSAKPRRKIVCFFCDEEGHKKHDCPKYLSNKNEPASVQLVDAVYDGGGGMGEIYAKRRADGPPMVNDSQTRMQKRVMASGSDPFNGVQGNMAAAMVNNGGYTGPLPGYRGTQAGPANWVLPQSVTGNVPQVLPEELVEVIERRKTCFSEVSGLGRVKGYVMDIPLATGATPI
ncbi:hypothetical protein BCV72DRAFT_265175 [Rhizopus microsporus var. microsporus]|uniref:CCHC-type domain-containing protein n=1 Tax=Rhizopus microsporus var. microsporus TaxID=86635 RepID=A0A1X0QRV1_RHIZD|nr:hypothetical protein BCV72DRAFT_265175 [Rhizopus microsporus var. microsporus]